MFNKFEYEEMLSQCDIVGLKLISEILWCSTIVLHRKEKNDLCTTRNTKKN